METDLYIRTVVREYVIHHPDLPQTIKARIEHDPEADANLAYSWDISHHYKPTKDAAGIYIPSVKQAPSDEEATAHLMRYVRGFTAIGVKENSSY